MIVRTAAPGPDRPGHDPDDDDARDDEYPAEAGVYELTEPLRERIKHWSVRQIQNARQPDPPLA